MGNDFLASKVITTESSPSVRGVPSLATAVLGMVGITERGPIGVATLCTSFEDFVKTFGGDFGSSEAVNQVRQFYAGGGQFLVFTRTCHYTSIDSPTGYTAAKGTLTLKTAAASPSAGAVTGSVVGPWDLEPGDTLIIEVDGAAFSGTATFNATSAARECTNAELYALVTGQNLTVKIDRGTVQTVAFLTGEFVDIANATAEEVAAVLNVKLVGASASATSGGTKVTIASDKRGKGSYVEVTGGTANAALGFNVAEVNGTGSSDLLDIDAVTAAEAKLVIEAAGTLAGNVTVSEAVGGYLRITSATTGVLSDVLVTAASTADDEFGLDNVTHSGGSGAAVDTLKLDGKTHGAYANDFTAIVAAATSGVVTEFDLSFLRSGVVLERFPNLTMDDTAVRFVEKIVNDTGAGSWYLATTDLDASAPSQRPANGTYGPLTSGADGLGSINDTDFIGSAIAKNGLRSFDLHTAVAVTLLAVPDRATAAVQQAMYQYSEVQTGKRIFCLWDPPASQDKSAVVTYFETTAALLDATEMGAISWPRVEIVNPNRDVYGDTPRLVVPASGSWAATIARNDGRPGGIYQGPAGIDFGKLFGVVDVETEAVLDESVRDVVFPKNINPVNLYGGYYVDGQRCAKTTGNFGTIGARRGASFIEQTLKIGMMFAKHRNNTARLRAECDRTTRAFLLQQLRLDAFASMNPDEAFVVDWDIPGTGLNNAAVQKSRVLKGRIGLAFAEPAEFVWMEFSADLRKIEEALILESA